jgi:MinD-like ATPase involved in chromosome partitioning or flagellar assembly
MSPTYTVVGTKGGCGKSICAISLSIWMSKLRPKEWVLLLDGDQFVRTVQLKMCQKIEATLGDVLQDREPLERSVHLCDLTDKKTGQPLYPNLAIIPASREGGEFLPPIEEKYYGRLIEIAQRFDEMIKQLRKRFSYIVVDTPASVSLDHIVLTGIADAVIYITEPSHDSIEATQRTAEGLKEYMDIRALGVILNRLPADVDRNEWIRKAAAIAQVLGVVPEDEEVTVAFRQDLPIVAANPECPASLAFKEITEKVIRVRVKPTQLVPKMTRAIEGEIEELIERISPEEK